MKKGWPKAKSRARRSFCIFIHLILSLVKRMGRAIRWLNLASGALLILMGAFLVFDKLRL